MAKSRSKYRKVLADRKAQVHLGTEPAYQEKVEAIKRTLKEGGLKLTASELAREVSKQRLRVQGIEDVLYDQNITLEALHQMLVGAYDDEDVGQLTLADGGSVRVQPEPYVKVEDKAALRKWCIANGLEESLALPWQTLANVTKELLLDGQTEPTGTSVWIKNKVVVSHGAPDEE